MQIQLDGILYSLKVNMAERTAVNIADTGITIPERTGVMPGAEAYVECMENLTELITEYKALILQDITKLREIKDAFMEADAQIIR